MSMLKEIRKSEKPGYSWYSCVCGVEKQIRRNAVTTGGTKSCGCHRRKIAVENGKTVTTHGLSNSPVYNLWADSKSKGFLKDEWQDFETFYRDIGKDYQPGMQILGEEWVKSSESKKKRTAETSFVKFGVDHPSKADSVKEKIKKTNIDRYGVDSPSKLEAVKNKTVQTCIRKYGVKHHSMLQSYKDRASDRNSAKFHGKTSGEWAKELEISRSYFNILVREKGIEYALSHEKTVSLIETVIGQILTDLSVEFETQYNIGNRIADFFVPKFNLVIEADGHYWHSDAINDDNMYHFNKRKLYIDSGYSPLFFREGEIVRKTAIVRSIIANKIGLSDRFFARKCNVVNLKNDDKKTFFTTNHLMGNGRGDCLALELDGKILAGLQYTNRNGAVDISRFCSAVNTQVVGGFSRLLLALERSEMPHTVTNFVDLRYGSGNHLERFGFNLERSGVGFSWVKGLDCIHRMNFPGKTGYDHGFRRIYDCGQAKFVKKL